MGQLEELHNRLLTILWRSGETLQFVANTYEETDRQASARIDASYPASPRPEPGVD
jgi:hypothetical protein